MPINTNILGQLVKFSDIVVIAANNLLLCLFNSVIPQTLCLIHRCSKCIQDTVYRLFI